MEASAKIIGIIAEIEGFRPKAYLDIAGVPTIGYGSTIIDGVRVVMGQTITRDKALLALKDHVEETAKMVYRLTQSVTLSQCQFDALVSFTYNLGIGTFQKSSILQLLLKDDANPEIWNRIMAFSKAKVTKRDAKGNPVKDEKGNEVKELVTVGGLVKRRKLEADLYFQDIAAANIAAKEKAKGNTA